MAYLTYDISFLSSENVNDRQNVWKTYKKDNNKAVPYQTYRTLYAPQLSYGGLKWGKRQKRKTNKQTKTKKVIA